MNGKLRIGNFLISYQANGPGKRFVIWFQGCPFHCKGCINPEFWDFNGGRIMEVREIMEKIRIAREEENIGGVTFTGGEPLVQAKNILPLAREIKSEGLSILCYTGYLYEDIKSGKVPYAKELLRYIDILIDGPYIEEEKANLLWRGSRNQRVYFLTDRYRRLEPLASKEGKTGIELNIGEKGVSMTGIFDIKFWETLKEKLRCGK